MINDIVITFASSHHAMSAEDKLISQNIELELIPTPRKISSECGFALLVSNCELDKLKKICKDSGIKKDLYYIVKLENGEKHYEKSY